MSTILDFGYTAQRTVCMFLSAVIVAASLSLGAYGAQSMLNDAVAAYSIH